MTEKKQKEEPRENDRVPIQCMMGETVQVKGGNNQRDGTVNAINVLSFVEHVGGRWCCQCRRTRQRCGGHHGSCRHRRIWQRL